VTAAPRRRFRRRFVSIAAVFTVLLGGGSALAYFLAHGTGSATQNFVVGSAPTLNVNILPQAVAGSALTPGGPAQQSVIKIGNPGSNNATASVTLTATVKKDGAGGIFDAASNNYVDSCLASWFTTSFANAGGPFLIPAGNTNVVDTLSLAMIDSGTDQSVCENLQPVVTVTGS
jgi:hypothetical protein